MTKRLNKHLSRPAPGQVSIMIARDLLRLVDQFGEDPLALLQAAGLTRHATLLTAPGQDDHMLSHDDFTRLYAHCTLLLDEHAARQEGRDPLTKSGFDLMCQCLITCQTLRDVIDRMDLFAMLLSPRLGRLILKVDEGVARLDMPVQRKVRNACAYLSDLTGLSTYARLYGWLIGEELPLLGAAMRYPPLLDMRTIAHLMPCPIRHGATENSFRFPATYLDRPVIRSHHELESLLEHFPFDVEEPQSKEAPLSERIARLLGAMLASGEPPLTAADLARRFSISVATLKRRLASENTSLAQIKVCARQQLAMRLLADPRLTVSEVGRRAQFSDTGAFRRAFHQWTGQSPTAWRAANRIDGVK
ncbi:AraC family transcriptional regulator [Sphingobium lactosutens]|uniref:helix-turn-helix transcriptional regulator n=1 Tax=Sphingobium lactosutens TaxID=522773 RepID=UPI0015B901A1|nr:AraC family transcriptional regulator [Sphingobium lactosutens]NWK96121.1 AraC family transcriptional regulator [Sphingobium lactosutens]